MYELWFYVIVFALSSIRAGNFLGVFRNADPDSRSDFDADVECFLLSLTFTRLLIDAAQPRRWQTANRNTNLLKSESVFHTNFIRFVMYV